MANLNDARDDFLRCQSRGIEVADIILKLSGKYEKGEAHPLNILDPDTFLNFDSYKKALTLLAWRNRTQQSQPYGTETKKVEMVFERMAARDLTGEPQSEEDYTFIFSGLGIARETNVDEDIIKYHSPWVLVGAGLEFKLEVNDPARDFKKLLPYFADLKSGFSIKRYMDRPQAYLLGGVFEVGYDDFGHIFVSSKAHGPQRKLEQSGYYHWQSNTWRGKVSDFANFVQTMETALKSLEGTPTKLHGNGVEWYGLDLMFYETHGSHAYEQPLPERILGRVSTTPHDDEGRDIETRIYCGKEVDLDITILKDTRSPEELLPETLTFPASPS